MSCNCNNSYYSSTCCPDTPYPQVSHESVPSLIDNLVNALYGEITKSVVDGRVVWNIPCDPADDPAAIVDFPRLPGEGLLCYILRYFNYVSPIIDDVVTISGNQTITGQKTFNWIKLPVGTTATRPTGQTGLVRFNTDRNQFEGYNNTTWSGIGDQPVGGGTNRVFFENDIAMTDNYTITSGKNAMSAGPITVNPGVTLTVPSGSTYTIV
jgi:hypothetical protein